MTLHKSEVSILIIEDNPLNAAMLVTIINNLTHDITVSTSAERGLRIWEHAFDSGNPYQILITDINLPGMNGKELCQEIRDAEDMLQAKPRIKMIAISSDPPSKHLIDACRHGASYYLQKPVKKEMLLSALHHTELFKDEYIKKNGSLPPMHNWRRFMLAGSNKARNSSYPGTECLTLLSRALV